MSDAPEEKKSLIGGFAEWCAGTTLIDGAIAAGGVLLFGPKENSWLTVAVAALMFVVWALVAALFNTANKE